MSKKDEQQGTVVIERGKTQKWNDQYFKLNNRGMNRKINFEEKKFQERNPQQPQPQQPQHRPAPFPPAEQWAKSLLEIKQKPIGQREKEYLNEKQRVIEFSKQLIADTTRNPEEKKPIGLVLTTAGENIDKALLQDQVGIKAAREERKKSLIAQMKSLKSLIDKVDKIPADQGPVGQAVLLFKAAMKTLSEESKKDMTEVNFNAAIDAVKNVRTSGQNVLDLQSRLASVTKSKKTIDVLNWQLQPNGKELFDPAFTKQVDKDTDRTIKGHGEKFKPVLVALRLVETDAQEANLVTLEKAAKFYLADYNRRIKEGETSGKPYKPDKIAQSKFKACNDAIEKVRQLRARREIQGELGNLPPNPQSRDEEATVNRLKAKMLIETGGSKQLGEGESGASESFFLTDKTTGEKNFIFKPSDGEFDAGYGWPPGGGAPREVSLSVVNDVLKNSTGLDCGVSTTTLVKVNSPSVATERNGNKTERVGAIQNFAKSDRVLTRKLNSENVDEYDADFINQFPPEEIEKVAILDFVTLQMDRQASNLLVSQDETGNNRMTPIDAGNAMPSRKGFEAGRRQFTNNAALGGNEAKKPFSKDALEKINAINEDEIVNGMKKANEEMAKVDPNAGTAVQDENIEMSRRSIRFLKKAANAGLSKAEIAEAYANLFHKVLDAKPANKVDEVIDQVVQEQKDKPGVAQEIDNIPKAMETYLALGWGRDQFATLKKENPQQLKKIILQKKQNPNALAEIAKLIKEIGQDNLGFDPSAEPSITQRLAKVRARKSTLAEQQLDDPTVANKMQQNGWDYTYQTKDGKTVNIIPKPAKVKHLQRMEAFVNGGGDNALIQKGIQPAKMSAHEKLYNLMGGDAKLKELEKKGYNPFMDGTFEQKLSELELSDEYEKLGGDDAYVKYGGPQNKQVTLDSRVKHIKFAKENQVTDEADWRTADEAVGELTELLKAINQRKDDFTQAEQGFEKKRTLYARYAQEADGQMDQQAKQQRLEELKKEDDEVGEQMKQFGKWNRDVITPWKDTQRLIDKNELGSDSKVKQLNRTVTQAYDAYVVAFGAADDLGKDQLDLLRGLTKRVSGQKPTVEQMLIEIKKLEEQMTAGSFGATTKVKQQLDEVIRIAKLVSTAKTKTNTFTDNDWDLLGEWDTKARQAFEIAKANFRAAQRGRANASEYLKQSKDPRVTEALRPAVLAIKQAETDYSQIDKFVNTVLLEVGKLEKLRPVG